MEEKAFMSTQECYNNVTTDACLPVYFSGQRNTKTDMEIVAVTITYVRQSTGMIASQLGKWKIYSITEEKLILLCGHV